MTEPSVKTAPTLAGLRARRDAILALAARYGAYNVRVFGSVARGDATPDSDIDLLVNFRQHSLLDRIALMRELSTLLDTPVDIVQEKALKTHVRPQALREAVAL
jgi:predicted nucleotidyltransferase